MSYLISVMADQPSILFDEDSDVETFHDGLPGPSLAACRKPSLDQELGPSGTAPNTGRP